MKGVPERVVPFLRWAGGKSWLVSTMRVFSTNTAWDRYVEPFLGGGAVFFGISPTEALLGDANKELINAYNQVKMAPDAVEKILARMPIDSEQYYKIRSSIPHDDLSRATRFIYLNRTCFNGIWRTNRNGIFNVPFGQATRTTRPIIGNSVLARASELLRSVRLSACDFRVTLDEATERDLVYCDPAYTVSHANNGFRRYNEKVFSWKDQMDLKQSAVHAKEKGAIVIVSNAAHESIERLYYPFRPLLVSRRSSVGARKGRGVYKEFVFVLSKDKNHRSFMKEILRNEINS